MLWSSRKGRLGFIPGFPPSRHDACCVVWAQRKAHGYCHCKLAPAQLPTTNRDHFFFSCFCGQPKNNLTK